MGMQQLFFIFILLNIHILLSHAYRRRVNIKGTTTTPFKTWPSRKPSILCPETHRQSMERGRYCCKYVSHDDKIELNIYDPIEYCRDGEYIPCDEKDPDQTCKDSPTKCKHFRILKDGFTILNF